MAYNRDKVVQHARDFWWRPCQDGAVWIKSQPLHIALEASRLKLRGYGGVFLWYSHPQREGLFLLPIGKIGAAKNRTVAEFPDAVMLSSYADNPADERATLAALNLKPRYHGLNDCTHFTSECLITGGFAVTDIHARRGAPELYQYLFNHAKTKVLASDVEESDARQVISSGLMKAGDVIVYANRKKRDRHHGVLFLGDGTIAMHTYHQFGVPWQDAGGDEQVYSLFHISVDDTSTGAAAARWVGWWQLAQGPDVRFIYLSAAGHMSTSKTKPRSLTAEPQGPDYWFADETTLRTCVRMKAIVEELTMNKPDGTSASGKRLNDGSSFTATKL